MRPLVSFLIIFVLGTLFSGCSDSKRVYVTTVNVPGSLCVDPQSRHDEIAAIVSRVVTAFHREQHPVTRPVKYKGTPGWRFCGQVYTVGCNSKPDLIEFDPDWTSYVVGHDLFHVFAHDLGNKNPGRDPFHKDPRWPEWDRWRDLHR